MAVDVVRRLAQPVRQLVALSVIACGAALFAVGFRLLLHGFFHALGSADNVLTWFLGLPSSMRVVAPVLGGLAAGTVGLALRHSRGGAGISDVMEAISIGVNRLSMRRTLLKSAAAWCAIAGGGSIGREGPLIQFGGSLGHTIGHAFAIEARRARVLIAAGTAAGFAAAYNTPLAAILFVAEVLAVSLSLDLILGCAIAAAIATVITRAFIGAGPLLGARGFESPSPAELLSCAVLGVVTAVAAQAFMTLLAKSEQWFERSRLPQPARAAVGGMVVGMVAVWRPEVTGNGYEALNLILDGAMPLSIIAALLLAKPLATSAAVSSGVPGGVFTPTMVIGACVGCIAHCGIGLLLGGGRLTDAGAYALVGMAASTSATTHAPLMAAVLVVELSGNYAIALPLLVATITAAACSRAMRRESIYEAELHRATRET